MAVESSTNTVAVYWDFENLHASLYDREWAGSRSYVDPRYRYYQQDVLVNVKAIMDYAASIGDVAINRAYNNWQWFSRYRDAFNSAGIDLIQIYPKGQRAKNGADIRLALDVMEDIFRYPKLTHVIIVSSDSDYVSLAQKLKQSGLTVIGVGVQQATNLYWAQNCDEFKYYDTLLVLKEGVEREARTGQQEEEEGEPTVRPMSLGDARSLLLDALRRLIAQKGEELIPRGSLKQMMKRMDSTFDEANLGFLSFSAFIKAFPELVEDFPDDSGGRVRLRGAPEQAPATSGPAVSPAAAEQDYDLILRRGNVRMLPCPWWREAVRVVEDIFREAPQGRVASFDDLEGQLTVRLAAAGLDSKPELAHQLRGFLFALWQFDLDKKSQKIGLKVGGGGTLLHCVEREIVRRITKFAAPPGNAAKVAAILHGEDAPQKLDAAQELIDSFDRVPR
jgi:uncharacterized LabA/DUF88 family protein